MTSDLIGKFANETGTSSVREYRVGLIGKGIGQSRTPAMHIAEAKELGLTLEYDLIDVEDMGVSAPGLADLLDQVEALGYAGVNVTYPFKKAIIPLLDDLSDPAKQVGAVNTVVFRDGIRRGHNTDFWGFAEGFRRGLPKVKLGRVLLLGAGGAGGAVAHALRSLGAKEILIFDARPEAAHELAVDVGGEIVIDIEAAASSVDGIINATPMGMAKLPGAAIDTALLEAHHWVVDIVYFPIETELLREARARRCRVLNGSGMAVFQAVRAFAHFTGLSPDPDRMRATFEFFDQKTQQGG